MRYAGLLLLAVFTVSTVIAGDETPQAVKDLLEKVKSGDGRAAVAIVPYGKAAVPGLIAILEDTNTLAQSHAAHALGRIGPAAKPAVPALVKALANQEKGISHSASAALGKIGPEAVPALCEALKGGGGVQVRALAAAALKEIGPAAKDKAAAPLLAALKQNMSAQDPDRLPIVDAIGEMGAASKEAVPVLVDMARKAKTPNDGVTIHVIVALGKIGPAAKEGLPLLTEVVKRPQKEVGAARYH